MTAADRRPTRLGTVVALLAGLLAVVPGLYSAGALLAGAAGLVALALGLARGTYGATTVAAGAYLVALVLAGVGGAPTTLLLLAGVAAAVAWDAGAGAVELGQQVGRGTDTTRVEALRLGVTAFVGLLAAGIGFAVFRTATGGQPVAALLFLLLAAVLLASALR